MNIGFLIAKALKVFYKCGDNHCGTTGCVYYNTPSQTSVDRKPKFPAHAI